MDILPEMDKANPIFLHSLIGKMASVITVDNETHRGAIFVVDPISKTLALLQGEDEAKSLKILMYHAIKACELEEDAPQMMSEPFFEQDIVERKERLKNWLKKNLIEVVEEGNVLKVQDDFSIGPPYTVSQCVSTNEIVLERMIQLIEKMP